MKKILSKIILSNQITKRLWFKLQKFKFRNSKKYWENRYQEGGNSGAGSYGESAVFKADFLNEFVVKKNISRVVEFGCGDGNQASLFTFPEYIGLDISKKAIEINKVKFKDDKTKSFFWYDPDYFIDNIGIYKSDLVLSLDVIYHLVEDDVYKKYLEQLFESSQGYVIVYSNNEVSYETNPHVRNRKFIVDVEQMFPNWVLDDIKKGEIQTHTHTADVNFYIFKNTH